MKKILVGLIAFTVTHFTFASSTTIPSDALNLSGIYNCIGYGDKVGALQSQIVLTIDPKESIFSQNLVAYHYSEGADESVAGSFSYTGEAVANGNNVAFYFENIDPKQKDDHGVGISFVSHDLDTNAKNTTVIHKFYYAPAYEGGANGSETCTLIR